jgi:hypothetical protein
VSIKSVLTPPAAIGTTVGVIALAYTAYNSQLPPSAVVQATDAYDPNLEAGRKKAALMSVGLVAAVSLVAKDVTIFTLGGAAVIALDWTARHSICTHPATGQIVSHSAQTPTLSAVV